MPLDTDQHMFGHPLDVTFNVVVLVLPPERIVARSKKRHARGELRLLTNKAGDFHEHTFHYHLPYEMQSTRLHIVYVSTMAACQFFVRHGFVNIDRNRVASMFMSRTRVYPAINAIAHQVDFDVDENRLRQVGVHGDDAHLHEADAFDDADDGASEDIPHPSENDVLSDIGVHTNANEHDSGDAEINDLNDQHVDFDESAIDVIDGDMTWLKFISFTQAISARCATSLLVECIFFIHSPTVC